MNQVQKFLTKLYRGVGSSRATRYENLVARGEWALLQQERTSDPAVYQNAHAYFRDALITDITRKLLLPGDKERAVRAAVDTFWASEAQCAQTNIRLARFIHKGPYGLQDLAVDDFISRWRKEVRLVMGRLPNMLTPAFSRGSTLSDKGMLTTIPDKMSSQRTLYPACFDIHQHSVTGTVLDQLVRPSFVRGNRFFTVPKDSTKDRGCCVEASGAILLQLAVGKVLKQRYQTRYGVNLKQGKELHMALAKQASVDGLSATIDLSNASDTVSASLVKLVLPEDWYELLYSLRAPMTRIDGKWVRLEKFSSMGNGFTFELETILFRSLIATLGVKLYECCVFGDDIIVPTDDAPAVIAALKYFGFTPNASKTFCEGPFRESCGGDYFKGTAVRPHFLETLPDEPQHWVALANGLRRVDPDLTYSRAAWRFCVDQVPVDWRNFGPASLGDLVFTDCDAQPTMRALKCPTTKEPLGVSPHWRVKRPVSRVLDLSKWWRPDVQLAYLALSQRSEVSGRDDIEGYQTDWVPAYGVDTVRCWHMLS